MLIPEHRRSSRDLSAWPRAGAEGRDGPETEQVSAPLAWREAVRSAQLLLLQASRTMADTDDPDAKSRFRAAIMGLCRLEAKIDHYLAALEQPP